jgi:penicillin-binding protein 1B
MGRSRRRTFWLRLPVLAALVLAAGFGVVAYRAEALLSRLVLGGLGQSFSTRVFAAPTALGEGVPRDPRRFLARLKRLGYRRVRQPRAPGEYSWEPPLLTVFLRGFSAPLPAQTPGLFAAAFPEDAGPARVQDASGAGVPRVWLEPELAAELSGTKKVRREPADLSDIPQALRDAVVATEDKRFFSHWGLDPRAVARSVLNDLKGSSVLQGGSTITQQLAKNLFLSPRRTLRRKLVEAGFSFYLEARLSKERILALYLNEIYMGQDGSTAVAGVKAAADFYFEKKLDRLSLGECALLAGIIRSPYRYNPRRDLQASRQRRDFVLRRMREEGFITPAALRRGLGEPLLAAVRPSRERRGPSYFVAEVIRQALPRYGEEALFREGLSLYTSMDPLAQAAAEKALHRLPAQGALAALSPQDGRVLALVGGRDFSESQFNRATQARRQPGSAFKPFLYGAALERGYTAASQIDDRLKAYPGAAGSWEPRNYDDVYRGTTTVRTALAHSLNAAAVDLANQVGPPAIAEFARRMGVATPLEESLALALGTSEVSLLELTAAYAPFGNGGFRVAPRLIDAVTDARGAVLEFSQGEKEAVLDPARAYLLTSLLESVVSEGTARSLPLLGFTRPCAGKTGTTEEGRDAWFVGYTPGLAAGVWVGDDRNRPLKLTGAKDALPVWAAFMKEVAEGPAEPFIQPQGLVTVSIDPASGLKARSGCPQRRDEVFAAGTEPTEYCPLHKGGVWGWFKSLWRR